MTRTLTITITITDTPKEAEAIALEMRRFILRNTAAFVWDNCAVGSEEQPRRLTAEFRRKTRWPGE